MINEKNIFEKGMLISLQAGSYAGRKKMSKDQMKDLPTEIVRGVHDMFDKEFKELLQTINKLDREARYYVKDQSVPFPIDGIYFIGSTRIEAIIEELEKRKKERKDLINEAVKNYENAILIFKEKYPDYYELAKSRYPSKERFSERFYFKYQFIKISAPDEKSKFISPEMYKEEMKKFRGTIEEMKKEVLATIYQVLLETTARLKTQCTDGKPNQRTLNTLSSFLQQIDDVYSDFIDREDMKKMIDKVKKNLVGVTAEDLRDSETFKIKFGKEIGAIAKEIKALPDIPLKRAIDF